MLKYDQNTMHHCQRVAEFSLQIARKLDLPENQIEKLGQAAMLHDIGKIFVPRTVLYQGGQLTPAEWEIIKLHPIKGAEIARQESAPPEVVNAILHHHERYGGVGYPHCLKGKDIPLFSRIIAVADAFDAMTSSRPYRSQALSVDMALSEIQIHAGPQFDPDIVEAFAEEIMNTKGSVFIEEPKVLRL